MTQVPVTSPETSVDDLERTAQILPFDRGLLAPSPTSPTPMVPGLLGMPPSALQSAVQVSAPEVPGLFHELKILSLVLALAIGAGALVVAVGISLTV